MYKGRPADSPAQCCCRHPRSAARTPRSILEDRKMLCTMKRRAGQGIDTGERQQGAAQADYQAPCSRGTCSCYGSFMPPPIVARICVCRAHPHTQMHHHCLPLHSHSHVPISLARARGMQHGAAAALRTQVIRLTWRRAPSQSAARSRRRGPAYREAAPGRRTECCSPSACMPRCWPRRASSPAEVMMQGPEVPEPRPCLPSAAPCSFGTGEARRRRPCGWCFHPLCRSAPSQQAAQLAGHRAAGGALEQRRRLRPTSTPQVHWLCAIGAAPGTAGPGQRWRSTRREHPRRSGSGCCCRCLAGRWQRRCGRGAGATGRRRRSGSKLVAAEHGRATRGPGLTPASQGSGFRHGCCSRRALLPRLQQHRPGKRGVGARQSDLCGRAWQVLVRCMHGWRSACTA